LEPGGQGNRNERGKKFKKEKGRGEGRPRRGIGHLGTAGATASRKRTRNLPEQKEKVLRGLLYSGRGGRRGDAREACPAQWSRKAENRSKIKGNKRGHGKKRDLSKAPFVGTKGGTRKAERIKKKKGKEEVRRR